MNTRTFLSLILLSAILCASLPTAAAPTPSPKGATVITNLFPPDMVRSLVREVDFMKSLFEATNNSFDQKIFNSVKKRSDDSVVISFRLVSFIFFYPTTNGFIPSTTEAGQVDELLCSKGVISRRTVNDEVPLNYVRVLDAHRKHFAAEVDVLLGVAPLGHPEDIAYHRRSFHFTYRDAWKED